MNISSNLFNSSFSHSKWKNEDKIQLLLSSLDQIELSIKGYLDNITTDFPNLTDHSLNHSEMLWNYAEKIVGDNDYLNPMEAFVLHVAFLVHDSGMCYSILNNKQEVENDPVYLDYLARNGEGEEVKAEALFFTVRQKHGDFALRVATNKLSDGEYLISNISLREELGSIIGRIAKSHTCNINYIENEFGAKYTTPKFPIDWSIDCQKLAFILRTADAAHIDNLRTPKTLKMISDIPGVSKDHWTFQKKLGFPELGSDNLLVYSTNNPFGPNEQKAWWFCHEALNVLDKELKQANEYFTTIGQRGFQAKGVKCIENTLELGKTYIRTKDWFAIDTRIHVSKPVHIASELGGVKLYGQKNIAVRELIQNSIDAINLYRYHTDQDNNDVGEIKIALIKNDNDYFLTLTDNGIGMSQVILTNELLDFGGSYWKSSRFQKDFKGLQSKGFDSIGQFGIGFFSIFMLGSEIQVTSWKFGQARDQMMTLDFFDGLNSNPILRKPTETESKRVIDRGTSIKIKLEANPFSKEGILQQNFEDKKLNTLVKFFVPSPNVRIKITEADGSISEIVPNAMEKMDSNNILDHVYLYDRQRDPNFFKVLKQLKLPLFTLRNDDKVYGRLSLIPPVGKSLYGSSGIVISKGIRVYEQLSRFVGYIYTPQIVSIKRDTYIKDIPYKVLLNFAVEQKEYIESKGLIPVFGTAYLELLLYFNFFHENFPILNTKKDGVYRSYNIRQFREVLKSSSSFKLYQEGNFLSAREKSCDGFLLKYYSNYFENLVIEEEKDRFLSYEDIIRNIIREEWGSFSEKNIPSRDEDFYRMDYPYTTIKEFIKD